MIDIHCHALYGVDDGPFDLEASLQLCRLSFKEGIRKIIATPHYIIGENCAHDIKERVAVLNNELRKNYIKMEIYPGNEAFIDYNLVDKLISGECLSLNNSKYVLLELPMLEVPRFTAEVIYEIQLKGYVPIIAHPERNRVICEKPEIIYKLVKDGCLVQLNSTSLMGYSGEKSQNTAKQLLKHNLAHFIATDAHSTGVRRPIMLGVRHALLEVCGSEAAERISGINPDAVLHDGEVDIGEPITFEKVRRFWQIRKIIDIKQ
jgi:protein-tyrosine phosphatase